MYSLRVPEPAHTRPVSGQAHSVRTSCSSVYSATSQHVSLALSPRSLEMPVVRSGPPSPRPSSQRVRAKIATVLLTAPERSIGAVGQLDLAGRLSTLAVPCSDVAVPVRRLAVSHATHATAAARRSIWPAIASATAQSPPGSATARRLRRLQLVLRPRAMCADKGSSAADSPAPAPYRPTGGVQPMQRQRGMVASKLEDDGRFRRPLRPAPEPSGGCGSCCVGCLACVWKIVGAR